MRLSCQHIFIAFAATSGCSVEERSLRNGVVAQPPRADSAKIDIANALGDPKKSGNSSKNCHAPEDLAHEAEGGKSWRLLGKCRGLPLDWEGHVSRSFAVLLVSNHDSNLIRSASTNMPPVAFSISCLPPTIKRRASASLFGLSTQYGERCYTIVNVMLGLCDGTIAQTLT